MKKLNFILTIALAIGFQNFSNAQSWQNVGQNGFSSGYVEHIPMVISSSVPYVAFSDDGNAKKGSVMKYDNAVWTTVGGQAFSSGYAGNVCMKFAGSVPYIAYIDQLNTFHPNASQKVNVKKFDGTNWINVGSPDFSPNTTNKLDFLFIDTTPYVSFLNTNNFQGEIMKYDGSNWITLPNAGTVLKIATDGTDLYAATINNANNGKLSVKKFDGTNWSVIGNADFSFDWVYDVSFAFNGSTPYVAITDPFSTQDKIMVMTLNGGTWVNEGFVGFLGQAHSPDLIFHNSIPYLGFIDFGMSYKVRLLTYNGNVWNDVVSNGISSGSAAYPSIAFNGNTPYVSFRNDVVFGKAAVLYLNNTTTGIEVNNIFNDIIEVYPNPTNNQLNFSTQTNVLLTNFAGQFITQKNKVNQLDISSQPSGIYFITFTDNSGQVIKRCKIVKE